MRQSPLSKPIMAFDLAADKQENRHPAKDAEAGQNTISNYSAKSAFYNGFSNLV
jgi:hypothetical protein